LAKQGIEHIKVIDFDKVEIENTGSQFYTEKDI
jgi:molybdopterin/thiamine biosynthesis adenylyltransferase